MTLWTVTRADTPQPGEYRNFVVRADTPKAAQELLMSTYFDDSGDDTAPSLLGPGSYDQVINNLVPTLLQQTGDNSVIITDQAPKSG